MKIEEKRKEVMGLVNELEELREQGKQAGVYIATYAVKFMPLSRVVARSFCAVIASFTLFILCAALLDEGAPLSGWISVVVTCAMFVAFSLIGISAFILLVSLVRLLHRWGVCDPVEEIGCTKADIDTLQRKVDECRREIKEFEQKMQDTDLVVEKLSKLEPIIVDELKGKMKISRERGDFSARATIDGVEHYYPLNEDCYGQIVRWIVETRKLRELVADFERELV